MRFALKVLAISLFCAGLWSVAGSSSSVSAHEGEDHGHEETTQTSSESTAETEDAAPAYEYVTPRGCSLSLLARRSLQLHDANDDSVKLSQAQIIYAETNLVRDLGGRLLEIGERVSIPADAVADYAAKSQSLSAAKKAAWQQYANYADFSISEIKPVRDVAQDTASEDNRKDEQKAEENDDKKDDKQNSSQQSAFWWLLGAAVVVGGIYYFRDTNRKK